MRRGHSPPRLVTQVSLSEPIGCSSVTFKRGSPLQSTLFADPFADHSRSKMEQKGEKEWLGAELNRRHHGYEPCALTI